MDPKPRARFLSLFVPDLDAAVACYAAMLGVAPTTEGGAAPSPHPYAARGPVTFELGGTELALYQCDMRTTHPGDVGIGLVVDGSPDALAARATEGGGRVFFGPGPLPGDGRRGAFLMLPDRHFFELLAAK
jgi:hypothetical protein